MRERKGTNFDALQKSLEKSGGGGFKKDERIWKPAEKSGKSENVIRFLGISARDFELVAEELKKFQADPQYKIQYKEEDLTPIIKVIRHQFQGPNGWYVENSLQTFGEACPVREFDGPNWGDAKKRNDKPMQEVLKKRLPKDEIYAGIEVIKDGTNPENNGRIMLYQVPATIKKMIDAAGKPEFESQVAFDPFDMWEGRNLNLNLTYETKQINGKDARTPIWTAVTWSEPTPWKGGDEKAMEAAWKQQHSLLEFHDRAKFKTYDELKAKLCKVMNLDENFNPAKNSGVQSSSASQFVQQQAAPAPAPAAAPSAAPAAQAAAPASSPVAAPPAAPAEDGLDEFEKMLAAAGKS